MKDSLKKLIYRLRAILYIAIGSKYVFYGNVGGRMVGFGEYGIAENEAANRAFLQLMIKQSQELAAIEHKYRD